MMAERRSELTTAAGMSMRTSCSAAATCSSATALEVEVLKKLNHHNIVKYIDSFISDNTLHIAMQYCKHGDLAEQIKAKERRNHAKIKALAQEQCVGDRAKAKALLGTDIYFPEDLIRRLPRGTDRLRCDLSPLAVGVRGPGP